MIIYIYTYDMVYPYLKSVKHPLSRRCLFIWSSLSFRPAFVSWVLAFAGTTQFKPK